MDIKDNTKQFEEHSQYDKGNYLGLIHINEFIPIPLQGYPTDYFETRKFFAGLYIGTSFRIKAAFTTWTEMNKYRTDNPELIYVTTKINCARI